MDSQNDENWASNNQNSEISDLGTPYSIHIRNADEEVAKVQAELCDSPDGNKLTVYKKALANAWDENNFLRTEIIASRRKTTQLNLQNEDMKEVIFELSESINYMTNGKLNQNLEDSE